MVVVFEDTFDTLDLSKWVLTKGDMEVKVENGKLVMRYTGVENQSAGLRTVEKFKLTPYGKVTVTFSGRKVDNAGNIFVIIGINPTPPVNGYGINSYGIAVRCYAKDSLSEMEVLGAIYSPLTGATFEYDESKNEISFYGEYLGGRTKIASEKWYFDTKEVYVMLQGTVGSKFPEASFDDVKVEVLSQSELMFQQFSQLIQSLIPVMFLFMFVSMIMSLITSLKKTV